MSIRCHPNSLPGRDDTFFYPSPNSSFQSLSIANDTTAGRFNPLIRHNSSNFLKTFGAKVILTRTFVCGLSIFFTSLCNSITIFSHSQAHHPKLSQVTPLGGCRSTPPRLKPPHPVSGTFQRNSTATYSAYRRRPWERHPNKNASPFCWK
jgi:hypothetical protein